MSELTAEELYEAKVADLSARIVLEVLGDGVDYLTISEFLDEVGVTDQDVLRDVDERVQTLVDDLMLHVREQGW